ncbi:FliA/WhiG family RNA polymerase sigma factor [Candidatus Uhrbacteria bacterium]|nr:FliA/WhiG family RNA polymerase sigma factor [Candidatus Uhrbacteria bacterium]
MQSRRNRRGSAEPPETKVTLLPQGRVRIEIFDAPAQAEEVPPATSTASSDGRGSALREILLFVGAAAGRPDTRVLVEQYMPLVRRVAYRLVRGLPANVRVDDLISAGYEGLLEAISRFDPARGRRLEQYAEYRIRGAMLDALRELDPLGRDTRARAKQVGAAVHRLAQRLGRAPEQGEIAEEMGMTAEGYHQLLRAVTSASALSLEDLREDGVTLPADEETRSPSDAAEFDETRERVARAITKLPKRQRLVLTHYYYKGLKMREIGKILAVTESRVCQIHAEGMQLLRQILQPEGES